MFKRFHPKGEYSRNILTLLTGTSIAQAIPIALSPVLTRLYTPENFGLFALYTSIFSIISSISCGSYEYAIMLPKKDEDALSLISASMLINLSFCFVVALTFFWFDYEIAIMFENMAIRPWLPFMPVSIFIVGFYQCVNYWSNRKKAFGIMSKSRILQSGTTIGFQAILGQTSVAGGGLIFGSILGQTIGLISQLKSLKLKEVFKTPLPVVQQNLIKYKKFPMLQAPSNLLGSATANLPVLLLGSFFGPGVAGFYSLSHKITNLPISLISSSIGDVFRQKASEDYALNGDARAIFIETLKKLSLIATPGFLLLFFIAPQLFSVVFGEDWRISGEYVQILTPLFWLSFIVSPLSVMFFIAEKQEFDLISRLFLIIGSAGSLWVGSVVYGSPKYGLAFFTAVHIVKYIVELLLAYKFSKIH